MRDEITSALDMSVQAAVLELLPRNCARSSDFISLLFISHDLAVVGTITNNVLMYLESRSVVQRGWDSPGALRARRTD